MANPILSSDLYKDDGAIERAIQSLIALGNEHEKQLKRIKKEAITLNAGLEKVNATTNTQRDEIRRTATDADKLRKEYDKYNEALSENATKLAALKNAQRTLNQVNKLEAQILASKEGSYNRLSAQYSLNKIRLNQMTAAERDATKEGKNLEKETKAIYEEMKRLQEATGKTSLNVGNYKDAVKGAIAESSNFNKVLTLITRNPFLGLIAVVAGVLTSLFAAFKRSAKGAELLAKAGGALEGVLSVITAVSVRLADIIIAAFEDPQQAVKDLWEVIKSQIVNRLKGVIDLFGAVGRTIKNTLTLNLDAAAESAKDAGIAIAQITTGLDEAGLKRAAELLKDIADETAAAVDAFANLAVQQRNVRAANRSLARSLEELITQEELYRAVADDQTKSFKEREEAAQRSAELLEQRAAQQIQIARNNLSIISQEVALRRAAGEEIEGLLDQQLSAYQELAGAEREYTLAVRDEEKRRAELKQDRLERDLDILIDGFDNQKTINERIIADEKQTLAARAALYAETQKLSDDSFRKQIATIQEFTGVAVDANDLIAESDAVVLNEKIRSLGLSEIIEGRLLEIIRDRRTAVQDLTEAERDLTELRKASNGTTFLSLSIDNITGLEAATAKAKEIIKEAKRNIQADLTREAPQSIYDLMGLNVTEDQKTAIKSAFDFAKGQLLDYFSLRSDLAKQAVQQSNERVAAAQREVENQLELEQAGYASRVEAAQAELALAKRTQESALREQKRAQKAQLAAQTVEQASNLITASSKIFSQLGFPLALPAIALMFGAFASAKIKAFQAVKKQEFAEGGLNIIKGGSHASGQDTPLGFQVDGKQAYGERGEAHMILSKQATARNRHILPQVFRALNSGVFEQQFQSVATAGKDIPLIITNNSSTDMSTTNDHLAAIRANGERWVSPDGKVERYKNVTRYYV